ncbi:hypothetical protein BF33_3145 [Bacillus cereus]|nr:hypothetical protein BG11_2557 [Bacillus cereus]AJH83862.1 hypothetical protein BF36_3811 [Bacillus thuringiensis]AJK34445.1 hypothetical protein BF33_3145 [Bacillus cereus]
MAAAILFFVVIYEHNDYIGGKAGDLYDRKVYK